MPLRRPLTIAAAAVCLLAVHPGAGRSQALLRPPPAARAAPRRQAAVAAELLRQARPYVRSAAALRAHSAAFPGEGAVELYHLRYEQVMPNGLSGMVEQRVFQIRSAAAADLFALDDVWYDTARSRFRLVTAQVLQPDRRSPGGWRVAGVGRDQGDLRPGGTGNQPRRVALPRLHAGDRISVLYELLPDDRHDWRLLGGKFLGNLFAFRDSFATVTTRYVLASRERLAMAQAGVGAPQMRRSRDGRWVGSWEAHDLPAFFSSPDGPSITDRSPFVQVSGFSSWAAMAAWYNRLLDQRARLSPAMERQLVAIAGRASTGATPEQTEAIVNRVWSYLSAHLGYRGNESGIHAYVPAPVGEVFRREQGDCKDGALLLATWLRAAGVAADLALVRTPDLGRLAPVTASGTAPATLAAFDHALVYVPATRQWIDTTAPDFLDTELPASDQNSLALIVRAGQTQLVHVPTAPASANLTVRRIQLQPTAGGWWQATGEITVRGAQAPAMRQRYAQPRQRRRVLANWLQGYFRGAHVDAVAVSGVHPAADTVRIRFAARIPPRPLQIAWVRSSFADTLAAESERRQALELPTRWRVESDWSLQLGDAGLCTRRPALPAYAHAGRFGGLTITSACTRGWYRVRYRLTQAARVVEPDQYDAFRAFWQSVDTALCARAPLPWGEPGTPLLASVSNSR